MNDISQNQSSINQNSQDSSNITTEYIKEVLGIPEWVDNGLVEKAAADVFESLAKRERIDIDFELHMAEEVWMKVKGYPIPDCYSEKDRLEIFERYYHRAVSQSQGE